MKSINTILLLSISYITLSQSSLYLNKNYLEEHNLKGNISKMITYEYFSTDSFGIPAKLLLKSKEEFQFSDGYLVIYKNCIEDNCSKEYYNYKNGKPTEIISLLNDTINKVERLFYSGRGVEMKSYNSVGSLFKVEVANYNKAGNKIISKLYDKDAYLENVIYYHYDNKGKLIQKGVYSPPGVILAFKELYYYDNAGNLTEKRRIDYYSNNSLNDNKINKDKIYKYTYVLDSIGNWIERITYSNFKIFEIEKREFDYIE